MNDKLRQKMFEYKLDDFLSEFDEDDQERVLQYALDHVLPKLKKSALTQPQAQQAVIDYVPGTWFKSQSVDQTQDFYLSRLPEIREAAREHGYAIGVHGSTRRDFDLIAMQWREGASDKDTLAHAIAMAACGIDRQGAYEWEEKGAGRVACSIPICWTPHPSEVGAGHIDLSLIKAQQAAAVPAGLITKERIDRSIAALDTNDGGYQAVAAWLRSLLDAAPPAPVLPLSDERIEAIAKPFVGTIGGDHWYSGDDGIKDDGDIERFARAIEAAHGITAHGAGGSV